MPMLKVKLKLLNPKSFLQVKNVYDLIQVMNPPYNYKMNYTKSYSSKYEQYYMIIKNTTLVNLYFKILHSSSKI